MQGATNVQNIERLNLCIVSVVLLREGFQANETHKKDFRDWKDMQRHVSPQIDSFLEGLWNQYSELNANTKDLLHVLVCVRVLYTRVLEHLCVYVCMYIYIYIYIYVIIYMYIKIICIY